MWFASPFCLLFVRTRCRRDKYIFPVCGPELISFVEHFLLAWFRNKLQFGNKFFLSRSPNYLFCCVPVCVRVCVTRRVEISFSPFFSAVVGLALCELSKRTRASEPRKEKDVSGRCSTEARESRALCAFAVCCCCCCVCGIVFACLPIRIESTIPFVCVCVRACTRYMCVNLVN